MRTVKGLQKAIDTLCAQRKLNLDTVPYEVQEQTDMVFSEKLKPAAFVERVLSQVKTRGDSAIREINGRLEGFTDDKEFEIPSSVIKEAYDSVSCDLVEALKLAAERISKFHESSFPKGWLNLEEGYGEQISPVDRVGSYAPSGLASTILMTVIPAKVAGVSEVILSTPGRAGSLPNPSMMVAADIAGVDRMFRLGGAQAIAAMAYGTETIPSVDVVCGAGNIFVTLAKKLLYGEVGIDGLYGPTETVVIADSTANPTLCAADLLAQAEHDSLAAPILISTSENVALQVEKEIHARATRLDRSHIVKESLKRNGFIVILNDIDEALELANRYAPEHISLMVDNPWQYVEQVRHAGAVFVGEFSHEVLGDYLAGPSHVMPTGGTARFNSGLNVRSFLKFSPVIAVDMKEADRLGKAASVIARAEGLQGHAEAAEVRQELLNS